MNFFKPLFNQKGIIEGEWDWMKPGLRQRMTDPTGGYLGPGLIGAGIGGLAAGKYALPGAIGGALLGVLAKHLLGQAPQTDFSKPPIHWSQS